MLGQSILSFYLTVLDKIKYSHKVQRYISACVIGLALAKLTDSGILAFVSEGSAHINIKEVARGKAPAISNSEVDILSIIGGPLYVPVPPAEDPKKEVKEEGEVAPQINYTLTGTLAGHPSFASAVLKLLGGENNGKTKEYFIGSRVGQDRIVWIGRNYINIRRNGQKATLKVGENAFEVIDKKLKEAQTIPKTDGAPAAVISKTVSRQDVLNLMKGNASAIYRGASFGPDLRNGKIIGYKIHKVKPGHIFFRLGARSGDIVRKVNGFELNDTERMFELWKSIKTAPKVDLELERRGKLLNYNFTIVN